MDEVKPKSKALNLKTQTVKFHPYKYTTHELQQSFNHGRKTEQTKSRDDLKRSCPADFKTPFFLILNIQLKIFY